MLSKQIELFLKAAETGSFSKAARSLYMAPASLIQQINLLEARLGVKLFHRGPTGITLTEAGSHLHHKASEIAKLSKAAISRTREIHKGETRVRIGTNLLFKCRELSDCCSKMVEQHPEVKVEIVAITQPSERDWRPLAGMGTDYDLVEGLYLSKIHHNRCGFVKLREVPILPAVPTNHRLSSKSTVTTADLSGETVVLLQHGMSEHFDKLSSELSSIPGITIVEVPFYAVDVLVDCEVHGRILMSPENWQDVHPNLHLKPFELDRRIPYGVMHAHNLCDSAKLLIEGVGETAKQA